ncbi:hypothetical protein GOP47_0025530 [Adiantum capillus-veneris]|uniref:Pollen Ole e 1 allergen and extensin family protein n=1 Tax=Adiantum capillus-veneris TaxID=13818 RepID=A0A9D4U0C3_ADICA|nr:hypothetical protein GOP47_0025530 [Adiantum capillus-veneris]
MALRALLFLLPLAAFLVEGSAQSHPLVVKGRVFCDACHAGHFSRSSFYLAGAKVGVQCGSSQGHVTAYVEGKTGPNGEFSLPVGGEHEGEYCVALVLHSPHPTCNLLSQHGAFATVLLTRNAGLADDVINTGPFAFTPNRLASFCASEVATEEGSNILGGE